ncbi:class I SAM-dependent methyltransferase [Desulfobacter sp. UBA2225]|uniref:class I SAM-dependent methyltransferase n=1 Tax=Desulfobacter sp. UBA2225 TaxID=1961413 RepID=UPI00257C5A98|nr:class I SAM-dependent methyltransferase [Desulfobacter sp. UBA2225]
MQKCTLIFVHPLPSEAFLAEAYKNNDKSVLPDDNFVDVRSSSHFSVGDLWVLNHLRHSRTLGNLLDIGSANTNLLSRIKALGWDLTVVEPSKNAVKLSRAGDINICRNTLENGRFDRTFDVISAIDVLELVHNPCEFLKKAMSLLSVNGIVLLRFPNSYSLRCRFERDRWSMIRPLGHLHFFSPKSFRIACRSSGLKILHMESHDLINYASLRIFGVTIRGIRYLRPVTWWFNKKLLGDQLLATLTRP